MSCYTILRLSPVLQESGESRSSIYRKIDEGLWTRPIKLGVRAVGWPLREVQALNAARIAGRTEDQMRDLVRRLHEARLSADLSGEVLR